MTKLQKTFGNIIGYIGAVILRIITLPLVIILHITVCGIKENQWKKPF